MQKSIFGSLALLALGLPLGAAAENDQEPRCIPTDTAKVYDIDEIVVIEQPKEAYRLRRQPLSSTQFSASQLANINMQSLGQLSSYVPSFSMPEYGSRITSAMYVRGIGSRINSPAVGIYVDGMPILSKSAFNFHTYDVERVDVLHGPQSTLYGMNTEGGLIRLFTRNPFYYQGTDLRLSLATKFGRKAEVSHYARVNDRFAYSLSGFYNGTNGFFTNQYNGERADQMNEFGGRVRLSWRPTTRWSLDFITDYQHVNQHGFPYGELVTADMIASAPITSPYYGLQKGTQAPNTNRPGYYQRNYLNTGVMAAYKGEGFEATSTTTYQLLNDRMQMDVDYQPKDYMSLTQKQLQNTLSQEFSVKSRGTGIWHWAFGAFGSYQWLRTEAPVHFGEAMNKTLSATTTQAAYSAISSAMQKKMYDVLIAKGTPAEVAGPLAQGMAATAITAAGGVNINLHMTDVPGNYHTPTYNLGVYHESNIEITPRLTATLGLRYDYSNVAIDYEASAAVNVAASVMGQQVASTVSSALADHQRNHFDEFLPKVGLTYNLGKAGNVYALFAKGYRAGGYNIQMFSDILQSELQAASRNFRQPGDIRIDHDAAAYDRIAKSITYKPETSWNYELGAHLNLLDSRLQFDLSAFYMQIRDQQVSVMARTYGFGRMMTNAAKSHSCGLEARLRGITTDESLSWSLAYGFTSACFDDYTDSVRTATGYAPVSYKDNHVPFVPQHTLAATADYKILVDPAALLDPTHRLHLRDVTVGLNLAAQGQTYWDEANTISQNFYAALGAHAEGNFGPLKLNLWVRNLTDTKYNTFVVQSGATGQTLSFAQLGNPFQLGIDLKYHF